MPFRPKEYQEPAVDPIYSIPSDSIASFYGVRVPGSTIHVNNSPQKTYGADYREPERDEPERLLSYEQARKLANS